jgi:hypothetical protein
MARTAFDDGRLEYRRPRQQERISQEDQLTAGSQQSRGLRDPELGSAHRHAHGQSRICKLLKFLRMTAFEEGIRTLLKIDAFAARPVSQPVVLIEAQTCRKGQRGPFRTNIRPQRWSLM